jgi:two-component SAPR family response regulator
MGNPAGPGMGDGRAPEYKLSLLAPFALTGPHGPVDLSNRKLVGLLAYLVLGGRSPQPRDKLLALLWGSHFEVQARQNLRQALFRLRRALGQDALIGDGDEIWLAAGVVDCDVARFERLVEEGSHASLAAAVALYRQRLLADVVIREEAWSDWVAGERQQLEGLALDALVRFGEIELALGHVDKALETAHRALAINNLREDAHRLVLRALAAARRRAEALKHYQDLVALLKRELKTEPDAATKALVAELGSVQPPSRSQIAREIVTRENLEREGNAESLVVVDAEPSVPMKVLVVDDHALIRDAAQTVLKLLKRKTLVFEASSGHQAMQIVEEHSDLSLILLDIKLPDCDGFSVLGELRERYPTIAIIMLAASDDQDEVKRAFSLGALGFIPKTTGRQVMLNAIQLVLSGGLYIPSAVLERGDWTVSSTNKPN